MRTVLVVRLDSVGDVLLAGPAVRAVAAAPDVDRVVLLCSPAGAPAGELLPGIDRIVVWRCPWIDASPDAVEQGDIADITARLAAERIDTAVVLTSFHQSPLPTALLLRLAGVRRIGAVSVDYPGALLDVRLRPCLDLTEDQPEASRALAVATALGFVPPAGDDGRLALGALPDVARLSLPARYVVVHPGASVPARAWPPASNAAAVTALAATGHAVVVTGGPDETALTAAVTGRAGIDLGGRTTLAELAAVLAGATAVVVGNTGPAHLAAAVGTPVVSLFAPVVPALRWAPHGVPRIVLGDQAAPCRDTRARVCPVPGHPCLATVTADDVVEAVSRLTLTAPRQR
ncbi:MAG TPA: glycosyltransferase family 9 protein [Pseudonocardiaceae bacterium]|jgi:ADP-heptose:LPS heptosyltransferase|nr:glycosyltransferase family 9 protein [Pseudonocardiaceae bacterium]